MLERHGDRHDERYLPRQVFVGGALLTFIAGQVNAIGVIGVFHEAITHVTGTITRGAIALAQGALPAAGLALSIVAAFAVGAVGAGALIGSRELQAGGRYRAGLLIEAAVFVLAWLLFRSGSILGEHVAAAGAGLQNGLVTTWSGAILRTSHVTGLVTDLALAVGMRLRGRRLDRRAALHTVMIAGFFVGGIAGALLWRGLGFDAFVSPIACCLLLAAVTPSGASPETARRSQ
ncbi:MAG TPA: YoaK family protein [Myxococcota bacterium]